MIKLRLSFFAFNNGKEINHTSGTALVNDFGEGKEKVHEFVKKTLRWGFIPKEDSSIGVIAQEVEKVRPDFVETRSEGYKTVLHEKFGYLALSGVKFLKSEVDVLKEKVGKLEQQVIALGGQI